MYFIIIVWVALFNMLMVCKSDTSMCQRYDAWTKVLERFCENTHQNTPSNCVAWQFQSIESYQVSQLKITGCDYYAVSEAIIKYKYVTSVTVHYSRNFDLGVSLDRLHSLNASHNALPAIPVDFFNHVPEIRVIDFSYNRIDRLEWSSFKHAQHLQRIYLAHNLLRTIQPEIITNLINLQLIDLNANQLYNIPEFSANKHLNAMHLEENPISTYDCFHISMMKSVSVQLSWENLVTFDGAWHCNGKRLRIIRNTAASEGIFSTESNGNFELHCNDRGFKHMRQFTAGRDAFQNVAEMVSCFGDALETITVETNSVENLDANAFRRLNNLKELRLSDTKLKSFDFALIAQPNRLNALDLSLNPDLQRLINIRLLSSFTGLREFKVAGNQLEHLPFEYLSSSVEILDVSGNLAGTLNTNMFLHLGKLKVLNLSDTGLSIFNENPFESLRSLLSLDVSHNNLDHTNLAALSTTLNRLQCFHAAYNRIQNPTEIIRHLGPSLVELNLAANRIRTLNTQTLQNLVNLKYLDISSNKLQEIEFQVTLNRLERLNLNGNDDLRTINGLTRTQFRSLKSIEINISNNNQFECHNLQEMLNEWENVIQFNNNNLSNQKHCRPNGSQNETGFFTNIYNKVKFW